MRQILWSVKFFKKSDNCRYGFAQLMCLTLHQPDCKGTNNCFDKRSMENQSEIVIRYCLWKQYLKNNINIKSCSLSMILYTYIFYSELDYETLKHLISTMHVWTIQIVWNLLGWRSKLLWLAVEDWYDNLCLSWKRLRKDHCTACIQSIYFYCKGGLYKAKWMFLNKTLFWVYMNIYFLRWMIYLFWWYHLMSSSLITMCCGGRGLCE